jgi:uncharacterized membrane protein
MNAFLIYLIVLRVVHFVGGTCWLGGAIIFHLFLEPTAKATAPGSQQFMQYFIVRRQPATQLPEESCLSALVLLVTATIWPKANSSSPERTRNWSSSSRSAVFPTNP